MSVYVRVLHEGMQYLKSTRFNGELRRKINSSFLLIILIANPAQESYPCRQPNSQESYSEFTQQIGQTIVRKELDILSSYYPHSGTTVR